MSAPKPLLGLAPNLLAAYPNVAELEAVATHRGDMPSASRAEQRYSAHTLPETVACVNPKCQQGGFNLRATLITAVGNRAAEHSTVLWCPGHEGSPAGRRKGDPCMNSMVLRLRLSYTG